MNRIRKTPSARQSAAPARYGRLRAALARTTLRPVPRRPVTFSIWLERSRIGPT
jgi:hypothetical protein